MCFPCAGGSRQNERVAAACGTSCHRARRLERERVARSTHEGLEADLYWIDEIPRFRAVWSDLGASHSDGLGSLDFILDGTIRFRRTFEHVAVAALDPLTAEAVWTQEDEPIALAASLQILEPCFISCPP
jgi:hypothetical protein